MTFNHVILITLIVYHHGSSSPVDDSSNNIIQGSNIVSRNMYQILGKDNENVLFCPISSNLLLSLVTLGAHGKTAEELKTGLHLTGDKETIKSGYQNLLSKLNNDKLKLATRLFPKTGIKLNPEYSKIAQKYFDSDVQAVDYNNATSASKTINTFVEEKTNNKIHDLVSPDSITPDTALILVNAAHFKDNWLHRFQNVYDTDFHLSKDKSVKTKMMEETDQYNYMESTYLNAKVLQIPFKNNQYCMVFILPIDIDGLQDLETKLASVKFEEVISNLTYNNVRVKIPKFKIETSLNLKPVLEKLGINRMFTSNAELNGIVDNEKDSSLAVTNAIQKTYIDVNEHGVEAAATTSITLVTLSAVVNQPAEEFTADHPFMFTIMHDNLIIFQGKLSKV